MTAILSRTLIAFCCGAAVMSASAATYRVVATEAERTGDWAEAAVAGDDAYVVIQGEINKATSSGDVVLLKAGAYTLTNQLSLAKTTNDGIIFRSDDGTGNLARETTLLIGGYPVTTNRLVYIAATNTVVEGFTLTNGYVNADSGGGAYLDNCGADSGLRNCRIIGCTAWHDAYLTSPPYGRLGGGGGAYIYNSGSISNCLFVTNIAFTGGGVYLDGTKQEWLQAADAPRVTDSELRHNVLIGYGDYNQWGNGAAAFSYKAAYLDHCNIVSNYSNTTAGRSRNHTVANHAGYLIVSNCVFMSNHLGTGSGQFTVASNGSGIQVKGCTFISETHGNNLIGSIGVSDGNSMFYCSLPLGIVDVRNGLFVGNTSWCVGNGLAPKITADNCTFINNKGALYSNGGGAVASRTNKVTNCIFYGNENDVYAVNSGNSTPIALFMSNCCIRATSFSMTGNRTFGLLNTNDCCFIYDNSQREEYLRKVIRFVDFENGDYRLQYRSALRDKGMLLDWMDSAVDHDGNPRCVTGGKAVAGAKPDIGCYECIEKLKGLAVMVR